MLHDNILSAVGNTPLIRLNRLTGENDAEVLVKYEGVNIGGSVKTRTALNMIEAAEKEGRLKPGSTIVEPTSGNQGIGLSLVGAVKGYKVVIIMPDSVSRERRLLITQYGAELKLVHDKGDIGECIDKCIKIAKQMAADDPNVFLPDQFSNPDNVAAHLKNTGKEILKDADGPIDGFCSGIGTGGTITGIGTVLKGANPNMKIVAAEPENAAILSGGGIGSHIQMGIGDGIIPPILDQTIIDEIVTVSDEDALDTTRRLAKEEGILCGISSGTNVFVALKMAKELGKGKRVVTVLPDTGERYFSTILFDR
ncbi:MAG: cysteine synthase A [Lachnospiraceae bacterium]|jgi:cysteine synthase A|nr:cysteine synthase A [Lachnospiraceae bacterium]